jgi:hypothetical protein
MTPTSLSTTAGAEQRRPLLESWLRRAVRHPGAEGLILRGSLLLDAWCPGRARPPADVDYLVMAPFTVGGDTPPGFGLASSPESFDAGRLAALAGAIAAMPDEGGPVLEIDRTELIWSETPFPGLRAHVIARAPDGASPFRVDFGFGDPLSLPPRLAPIGAVGPVLGCAPETLFAWKLHGLVEFGRGRWRAKDLYDLDLLWAAVPLERDALGRAVELAFASRGLPLDALADFRERATWGTSRSGARKWQALRRGLPQGVALPPLLDVRTRVRSAVEVILP